MALHGSGTPLLELDGHDASKVPPDSPNKVYIMETMRNPAGV